MGKHGTSEMRLREFMEKKKWKTMQPKLNQTTRLHDSWVSFIFSFFELRLQL